MKPLVIIKVGDAFANQPSRLGDFEDWIGAGLGAMPLPVEIIDPRRGAILPAPTDVAGAIITGSHAMVTDHHPWSEELALWACKAVLHAIPVLGIAYGHQLLAYTLGGRVGYHPGGIEIGSVTVARTRHAALDPLFGDLPAEFAVQVVHRQSVRILPRGAVPLAANAFEPHQAFRIGESAWGVQFHPEVDHRVMAALIEQLAHELDADGRDAAGLLESVVPTGIAARILARFGGYVARRAQGMYMPAAVCAGAGMAA